MSKWAVVGDIHIGARLDSKFYMDYLEKFFNETLIPYLLKHQITTVVLMGDVFDKRKSTDTETLRRAKVNIFDKLEEMRVSVVIVVGNHDSYFKNTVATNTPRLLLREYKNIVVVDKPENIVLGSNVTIDIIPWLCPENEDEVMEFMKNSRAKVCFGHFQLLGFEMDPGVVCHHGHDKKILNKYEKVFSGHFHKRSSDGHISYVGTPCQITWIDWNDPRGFHVLDTDTLETEFIENPVPFFHKLVYDDTSEDNQKLYKKLKKETFKELNGTYVKIIVTGKSKPAMFAKFKDLVEENGPIEVKVVDEYVAVVTADGHTTDGVEDTKSLIGACVDELKLDVPVDPLKELVFDLYTTVMANQ